LTNLKVLSLLLSTKEGGGAQFDMCTVFLLLIKKLLALL